MMDLRNHFHAVMTCPRAVPCTVQWGRVRRASRPGAFMLVLASNENYARIACGVEDAGWDIRDCIAMVGGLGGTLTPGWQAVLLAMNPVEKTYAYTARKWGTGGLNIPACRVGDEQTTCFAKPANINLNCFGKYTRSTTKVNPPGRWPSNLLLTPDAAREVERQSKGASRFFIKSDTVSQIEYLCRLIKPPGGGLLHDPFGPSELIERAAKLAGMLYVKP